jgi:hypothetical protein
MHHYQISLILFEELVNGILMHEYKIRHILTQNIAHNEQIIQTKQREVHLTILKDNCYII